MLAPAPAFAIDEALLPRNLSPWGMFLGADIIVKAVMVGLAVASLVTWTVWLAKTIELRRKSALAVQRTRALEGNMKLAEAAERTGDAHDAVAQLIQSCAKEAELSGGILDDGLQERVALRLERVEAAMSQADRARHRRARDHRRHRAVRRPVRHGLGHHEFLHRHLREPHHEPCGGRARHRGGAACHRARPRRRDPGGR